MFHKLDPKIIKEKCPHIAEFKLTKSNKRKCELCDDKEHLRICTSCSFVGCCESSNAHDTEHFRKTGHPIIKTIHTDYDFILCYKCKAYLF